MTTLALTEGQQAAKKAFLKFLCGPETVFVLEGYAGCGKSTLVRTLLDEMPNFFKMARLVNPEVNTYSVQLTATTNKAAENLARITGQEAQTIHSFLHLRVVTDFRTGETSVVPRDSFQAQDLVLFVDEASFLDKEMLRWILDRTKNCKIVFVGDPAQLTPVKASGTPVFSGKYMGAALTEVVRQAKGNPIVDLATQFRHTVNSTVWPKFRPDGHHVQWLDEDAFKAKMLEEFTRPDWKFNDSKFLAWRNKTVEAANHFVREHVSGSPLLEVDDYAVVNSFVTSGKYSLKTDQQVHITSISEDMEQLGVPGNKFTLDNAVVFFMPKSLELRNARLKRAKQEEDLRSVATIEESWIDLRAAYAQTVNKSQGSTYDKVFIDLSDIGCCTSGDQIARMLYVAVSRARDHVYLTGDIA